MLLALDVGNTNVTAGVFQGARLLYQWRHVTDPRIGAARFGARLAAEARRRGARVTECAYGSVVPSLDRSLERAVEKSFGCRAIAVTPRSRLGLRLRVRHPGQVGADRLLNAVAAYERARRSAVVLDFGTATTFDCVAGNGDYLGGAILLGPNLAAEALHLKTAKLPRVPIAKPRRAIGKDTVECIQAGLYFGYLGMIDAVLKRTLVEMPGRPKLYATGGLAFLFKKDLPKSMKIVPDLTLEGLRIAYERMNA